MKRVTAAWATLVLMCFFAPCVRPLTLGELLWSSACLVSGLLNQGGTAGTSCVFEGTLLLTAPVWTNTSSLLIIGTGPNATVQLTPDDPFIIGAGAMVSLQSVTVANMAFADDSPLNPSISMLLAGIQLLPGASLNVKGSTLSGLSCATWGALVQATCDLGRSPGDMQYDKV